MRTKAVDILGDAVDRRVERKVSRIVARREERGISSWQRVLEIGSLLREGDVDESRREALAQELQQVARESLAFYDRLGIDGGGSARRVMPSGMEVLEGGLAEAALKRSAKAEKADAAEGPAAAEAPSDAEAPPAAPEPSERKDRPTAQAETIEAFRSEESWDDLLGSLDEPAQEEGWGAPRAEGPSTGEGSGSGRACGEEPSSDGEAADGGEDADEKAEAESADGPSASAAAACEAEAPASPEEGREASPRARFACFKLLYESRDGSLCVFEDERGHLVSVDAPKLV